MADVELHWTACPRSKISNLREQNELTWHQVQLHLEALRLSSSSLNSYEMLPQWHEPVETSSIQCSVIDEGELPLNVCFPILSIVEPLRV